MAVLAGPLRGAPSSGGLSDFPIEDLLDLQADTVVSASRYRQSISDAPSSVSILTAGDIRAYGWRSLGELLQSVRGNSVSSDRTYSYLGSRGFTRGGDYNSRTLFLMNGQRLNDNIYSGMQLDGNFATGLELVDHVEIIRGPSSSLYGNSAFFGVLNIVTKQGRDYSGGENGAGGELVVDAGDRHTSKVVGITGGQFGDWEFLVSASHFASDGDDHLYFPEYDTPETNDGVAENADATEGNSVYVSLRWRAFTLESMWTRRLKTIPTASFGSVFNSPDTQGTDEFAYARLSYDEAWGDDFEVHANISRQLYNYDGTYIFDGAEYGVPLQDVTVKDYADGRAFSGEIHIVKSFAGAHTLIAGLEYVSNDELDQGNYAEDPPEVNFSGSASSDILSPFAQLEYRLSRKLTTNIGVRYDNYSTFGGTANPRLALIARPRESTTLKLLYGTAFRAPNAYETYYNDGGRRYVANPDLKPEEISTAEIVWEEAIGPRLRSTVSVYEYRLTNLINLVSDTDTSPLFFDNLESVKAHGVEAEIEGRLDNGASFRMSGSMRRTRDEATGERLTNSPAQLLKLYMTHPIWDQDYFVGLEALYSGARRTSTAEDSEPVWVMNLTFYSREFANGFSVSGSIYNFFNEAYGFPPSEEHLQRLIPADGRTFRMRASWRF